MASPIFITGLYRSGTTLLEKLLQNHPDIFIGSQSFPHLFFHSKRDFYTLNNKTVSLPLSTLFKSNTTSEFSRFLLNKQWPFSFVKEAHLKSLDYSGLLNKEASIVDIKNFNGEFDTLYNNYHQQLAKNLGKNNAKYIGSKEIVCEEFIPYFIEKGFKIILIARDPRSVLASLNYGKGKDWTGTIRPTLFNIRNWRKSIAFYLNYQNHPNVLCLKYEDLALNPWNALDETCAFLGVKKFPLSTFNEGIKDQTGEIWKGNSSYVDNNSFINTASIDSYKKSLSKEVISFIETLCYSEMKLLGYETNVDKKSFQNNLISFTDPFTSTREEFSDRTFEWNTKNRKDEIDRLQFLLQNEKNDDLKDWFIFEQVFDQLVKGIDL